MKLIFSLNSLHMLIEKKKKNYHTISSHHQCFDIAEVFVRDTINSVIIFLNYKKQIQKNLKKYIYIYKRKKKLS